MKPDTIKRGRPADRALREKRKSDLIGAAAELLRHKSYRSITIRELASEAGTQPAMIKYYFGDKLGLFLALLEQISNQQIASFEAILHSPNPIKAFIENALAFFSQNPPVLRLLIDDMLNMDSELKQALIEVHPKRMADRLPELIIAQQQAGLLRADLDPKWAAFSLISLILTPFITAPVREQAWNISNEELSSERWADHLYQLFSAGVQS